MEIATGMALSQAAGRTDVPLIEQTIGAFFDRTVDAHIKTLRAKLRVIAPEADPIHTHRGLGYSLRPAP